MKYVIKKVIGLIITLLIVSILAFLAFDLIPGDPARQRLGIDATEEEVFMLQEEMGLHRPLPVRYGEWLVNFVRGNMGESFRFSLPVREMIQERLPINLTMVLLTMIMILLLTIPLSTLGAYLENTPVDRILMIINQVIMSVPSFFIGMLLTMLFGIVLRFFVPGNFIPLRESFWGFVGYLILPSFAIALPRAAMMTKMFRNSLRSEMTKPYVITALSRGNGRWRTLIRHVFKNGFLPMITMLGLTVGEIVTGSIIIEQVFGIPGLGRMLISSISGRDYPVTKGIIMLLAIFILVINVVVDILYKRLDRRIEVS